MGYRISAERIEPLTYEFKILNAKNLLKTVYLLKEAEFLNPETLLSTTEDQFTIKIEAIDYRPYFAVSIDNTIQIVGERTLPVEGMNNFRDMGGYETEDGHHVKWGKLYRSDHIYNAKENGIEYLRKLGIHTIIDYRSPDEQAKYPNKIISDEVKKYSLDPSAHTAELAAQFTSSKESEDVNLVNKIIDQKNKGQLVNRYDIVMEQYSNFVTKDKSKQAFKEMLIIAADPSSAAMVQHCRGGKDRTGFGSMLLLGLLGVKKEYLIHDYMLTHTNRIKRNNFKMDIYRKYTSDPVVLEYLYSLIDTRSEFIEASYDAIINTYHSIEGYAKQELGITDELINQLKSNYLE